MKNNIRNLFLLKVSQIQQSIQPSVEKSESLKSIVENSSEELTKRVEQTLNSPTIYNWLIDKVETAIEPEVKQFVSNNKDKIAEYASNPDTLVDDISEQVSIFKYLKYLSSALDVGFIVTSLVS